MQLLPHAPALTPHAAIVDQAQQALRDLQWRTAALLFTQAADVLQPNVRGVTMGQQVSLRRSAHLALCRTTEFRAHRERQRNVFCGYLELIHDDDWRAPDGSLVHQLLGAAS